MLGYLLHVGSDQSYLGAGLSAPKAESLAAVRRGIESDSFRWQKATSALVVEGEQLKRTPKGYSADTRFESDLRRKSYFAKITLGES